KEIRRGRRDPLEIDPDTIGRALVTRMGLKSSGARCLGQILDRAAETHEEMMVVGIDLWTAARQVRANFDLSSSQLKNPWLCVVARSSERRVVHQGLEIRARPPQVAMFPDVTNRRRIGHHRSLPSQECH